MPQIDLNYVTIRYDEPIIYLIFKPQAELGFPEMKELTSCAEKLSDHKPYLILADNRENVVVTPEGRKYSSESQNSPLQKGTAVLVKNGAYQLAANFFMGLKIPIFPFRAFTDEQEAQEWLLSLPLKETTNSQ